MPLEMSCRVRGLLARTPTKLRLGGFPEASTLSQPEGHILWDCYGQNWLIK